VSGSVILSAVMVEPEMAPEKFRVFLNQGIGVAEGVRPVPTTKPLALPASDATARTTAPRQPAPRPRLDWE
jgi:hypothetical protein